MKIYIYAIAKNELQFCERFMRSCAGADGVAVLDTGSTDGMLSVPGVNIKGPKVDTGDAGEQGPRRCCGN